MPRMQLPTLTNLVLGKTADNKESTTSAASRVCARWTVKGLKLSTYVRWRILRRQQQQIMGMGNWGQLQMHWETVHRLSSLHSGRRCEDSHKDGCFDVYEPRLIIPNLEMKSGKRIRQNVVYQALKRKHTQLIVRCAEWSYHESCFIWVLNALLSRMEVPLPK